MSAWVWFGEDDALIEGDSRAAEMTAQSLCGWSWDRGAEWAADVEAEREACARIAEREDWACGDPTCADCEGFKIGAAIRERGKA